MDRSNDLYEKQVDFKDRGFKIFNYKNVQEYPFNCIGALYFQNRFGETGIGTGFLVGPDIVLTTAHNVYSRDSGEHQYMRFFLGVSGDFEQSSIFKVVNYRIPREYTGCQEHLRHHYDYALLKLERQTQQGSMIQLGLSYSEQSQEIGISGYRRDAHSQTSAIQFGLWKKEAVSIINYPILSHKLSTFQGNSGSPILVQRKNKIVVVAIHAGAYGNLNEARLITNDLVVNLLGWEREMAYFKTQIAINQMEGKNQLSPIQHHELINKFHVKVTLTDSRKTDLNYLGKIPLDKTQFSLERQQNITLLKRTQNKTILSLKSIIVFNDICLGIEKQQASSFMEKTVQYSSEAYIKDLIQCLLKLTSNQLIKNYIFCKIQGPPRLWLVKRGVSVSQLFSQIRNNCKSNPTFEYKLYMDGVLLKEEKKINQYDIDNNSLIVVEYREQKKSWLFFNQAEPLKGSCTYCRASTNLSVICNCKTVVYCSEKCLKSDQYAHRKRCTNPS